MLNVTRKENEAILIYPAEGIDPRMTVAELFGQGPIWVAVRDLDNRRVKVCVEAPQALRVMREELVEKRPCQD